MFFSLDDAVKAAGLTPADDVSACLPADATEVTIEGGPYRLDAPTLTRLLGLRVTGGGSVKWAGYRVLNSQNNPDPFDGIIPVSKMGDPIFLSSCLPSEANTYMKWRVNPGNMLPYFPESNRALAIGAIYRNEENPPADDEVFTICLGRICLLFNTPEQGWYSATDDVCSKPNHIYGLPWEKAGNYKLDDDRLVDKGDHVEITVTGADLNGRFCPHEADAAVLHFWSKFGYVTGGEVLGAVSSYVACVKEPEAVGKLVAAIGIDWYSDVVPGAQAYSGRNYLLTTEPRALLGHNVGPKAYDRIMDTARVKELLKL
ncbi:MAG: hypothetical protein J6X61_00390 [Clostridia bacterium]|nr:hypothetical protein [Clostridia bacterium]